MKYLKPCSRPCAVSYVDLDMLIRVKTEIFLLIEKRNIFSYKVNNSLLLINYFKENILQCKLCELTQEVKQHPLYKLLMLKS